MVVCLERGATYLHIVQLMSLSPVTPSSLAPVKSRMVYLSGAGLPRLSWKKRPLNGCSVVMWVVSANIQFSTVRFLFLSFLFSSHAQVTLVD